MTPAAVLLEGVAAIDHTNAVHDRFRTLAMSRSLPSVARTMNEMVFTIARTVLLVSAASLVLGFRFHGSALDAVAALGVLIVLAGSMSALFGRIGDALRRPDVVQFAGMMVMMPLMFVSSAFAPLDTMPGWTRALANVNPVSHVTDAVRTAVIGASTAGDSIIAVLAGGVLWLIVVAVPATRR